MNFLVKIFPFIRGFKKEIGFSVLFNLFCAIFGALSFVSIAPIINILFDETKFRLSPPVYQNALSVTSYCEDYLNYYVTSNSINYG